MQKLLRFLGWTLGVLLAIIVIARLFFMKAWTIPDSPVLGASIAPTLRAGDVVLLLTRGTPGFGDLVRCPDPEDSSAFVVGRIAGVAGDVVETQGAKLIVNTRGYDGESVCAESKFTVPHPTSGSDVELSCDIVRMGGGWHYRGYVKRESGGNTRKDVGKGMVYLISDDRTYHDDSRDYGTLPASSCTERIVFRLWGAGGWSDDKARLSYIR